MCSIENSLELRHMLFRENDFSYLLPENLKLYLVRGESER